MLHLGVFFSGKLLVFVGLPFIVAVFKLLQIPHRLLKELKKCPFFHFLHHLILIIDYIL